MRKGKRFTPAWIRSAIADGRGQGTGNDYVPWHQIRRADPGSRGRSHLQQWLLDRLHHLLSDQELAAFLFATMGEKPMDLREQFPLARDVHEIELASYCAAEAGRMAPGTRALAVELGIRHPIVRHEGDKEDWVMTTDLLITNQSQGTGPSLLAVSVKTEEDTKVPRKRDLLLIERSYWQAQDAEWLLYVPTDHNALTLRTVLEAVPWALHRPCQAAHRIEACAQLAATLDGLPLRRAFDVLTRHLGIDLVEAQRVFWQSVWTGRTPLRLDRFDLQLDPIELLDDSSFWAQNPIVSRRSSW